MNSTSLFDATYQRYLLNYFREKLPFRRHPGSSSISARELQTDPETRRTTSEKTISRAIKGRGSGRTMGLPPSAMRADIDSSIAK